MKGPVTLLPVVCPRCKAEVGDVRAWTETEFTLDSDGKTDTGRVRIEVKVQSKADHGTYASGSTSVEHVCETITAPAAP